MRREKRLPSEPPTQDQVRATELEIQAEAAKGEPDLDKLSALFVRLPKGAHRARLIGPCWFEVVKATDPTGWATLLAAGAPIFELSATEINAKLREWRAPAGTPAAEDIEADQPPPTAEEVAAMEALAAPLLDTPNPLARIARALKEGGLGGDPSAALQIYLAMTGRVLAKRKGSLQAHTAIIAESGTGKSYMLDRVVELFPRSAVLRYSAASPRVLIYDHRSLKHRVVIYAEIESIPGAKKDDDQTTAASAVRNLAQDGEMHYAVVESVDGVRHVRHIRREGPSCLITTGTRAATAEQFSTRFSQLTLVADAAQVKGALTAQAKLELADTPPQPDPAVVALQGYLQARAPFDVMVPYVYALAELVRTQRTTDPRIMRDMSRLVTLIKATAILNHRRRATTSSGRICATLDDYAVVLALYNETYQTTATGATTQQRELVEYIRKTPFLSGAALAGTFEVTEPTMSKRLKVLQQAGWIKNVGDSRQSAKSWIFDNPLPEQCGLPSVEAVTALHATHPMPPDREDDHDTFEMALAPIVVATNGATPPAHTAPRRARRALR